MRTTSLELMLTVSLFMAPGLAQTRLDERAIPSPVQWPGSEQPPKIETVSPRLASWTTTLDAPSAVPVLTDKVVVVAWCAQDSSTCYLQSFDLATGKPARKTELSRIGHDLVSIHLYPQTGDTFLVDDGQVLTEFDSDLRARSRLKLPSGMGLTSSPAYGYSDWARVTGVNCTTVASWLFHLGDGRKLFLGCGGMGVLDRNWKLIFAETLAPHNAFGWPVVSQDGGRFILPVGEHHVEPPLHATLGFRLYDIRSKLSREFVFRTADELYSHALPALSPNGTTFALLGSGKLSVYTLPK